MRKIIGIIMPYIIICFALIMSLIFIEFKNIIISLCVGLFIGIWLITIHKCPGTLNMIILTSLNCLLYTIGLIMSLFIDIQIMHYLSIYISLLVPLNYICLYILLKHKSTLHMSYRYSYKNRKRRYF